MYYIAAGAVGWRPVLESENAAKRATATTCTASQPVQLHGEAALSSGQDLLCRFRADRGEFRQGSAKERTLGGLWPPQTARPCRFNPRHANLNPRQIVLNSGNCVQKPITQFIQAAHLRRDQPSAHISIFAVALSI